MHMHMYMHMHMQMHMQMQMQMHMLPGFPAGECRQTLLPWLIQRGAGTLRRFPRRP